MSTSDLRSFYKGGRCAVLLHRFREDHLGETKSQVILVEDDPSVLRALRRLLESAGFKVKAFDRPSSLRAAGIPDSNACLIFDVHLPEMTGVELYQAITASGCRCPLILITGYVDEATRALSERVKPAAFLMKPFNRDRLLAAIQRAFASAGNPK
jgi:FixJ family two-component response regulator